FDLAVQHGRRAVAINPNNQWNAADLGTFLISAGQSEEALKLFSSAREVDPYFNAPWYWRAVGLAQLLLQRYEAALSALAHASIRPYQVTALAAACHARLGDAAETRASVAECLAARPDFSIVEYMKREPFKLSRDVEQLRSSLRLAGL